METVLKAISDWIKSLLTAAIMSNLNGLLTMSTRRWAASHSR